MLKLMSQPKLDGSFTVASFVGATYDWALTFGQEVELVWISRVLCQKNNHDNKLNYRGNIGP